jgi:hypothetical protein
MEVILNQFIGYNLKAPDGHIGTICDFYFDERSWRIRYLMVNTGNWLHKNILISPLALLEPDVASKTFPVKMTRNKIADSQKTNNGEQISVQHPSKCRRTQTVTGCLIKAPQTILGKVFDYILEDKNWQIRFLVIKVDKSISEKILLMDSRHLNNIFWSKESIELNL